MSSDAPLKVVFTEALLTSPDVALPPRESQKIGGEVKSDESERANSGFDGDGTACCRMWQGVPDGL